MAEHTLITEILKLSKSENWFRARREWEVCGTYETDIPETCLCGHYPIRNVCMIENSVTGVTTRVGNCCVNKFMKEDVAPIMRAIIRVKADHEKALNIDTVVFARKKNWINDWEYNFLIETSRKRSLTQKQLDMRIKLNNKILGKLKLSGD